VETPPDFYLIETEHRHGDRRHEDRREKLRPGQHDRRRKDRRRGRVARTGMLLTVMSLATGARVPLQLAAKLSMGAAAGAGTAKLLTSPDLRSQFAIEMNDAVHQALDKYRGQPFVAEALTRGSTLLPQIKQIFEEEGVPSELAYLALVESEFRPHAQSWAQARGVWQFMPVTGKRFGLQQDSWIDERSDPEKATRAAAKYLRILFGMFDDWNLALAAYNAGEGTILKAIKKYGTNDFWRLAETKGLAQETKNYVPRIHAAILLSRDPLKYGIEIAPAPVTGHDVVPVGDVIDLKLVADCVGADVDALRNLNPALKRWATPADQDFDLRVPAGAGDDLAQCIAKIPEGRRARIHRVRKGETLAKLARRYGTKVGTLAEANSISRFGRLRRGAEIIIPMAAED
jgi:membrane-bound lytic murein transglycosylase D